MNLSGRQGGFTSLYLSLPFCSHKCTYCDLNAYAGMDSLIPEYAEALVAETHLIGSQTDALIHTVYFGGGTPSIIPLTHLEALFSSIRQSFRTIEGLEISFESNPENLNSSYLLGLKDLGVTRLSIGAQSAQPGELALFQRTHTFQVVCQAVEEARRAGFDNLSVDLIYGIPGQGLAAWQDTLRKTLELRPEHLSAYALSVDFGTPIRAWIQRGLLAEPTDDIVADMYDWASQSLADSGFQQYEISSWAFEGSKQVYRPAHCPAWACRHNLQYWRGGPYLGLGAGAHGYFGGWRYANIASPTAYVQRMSRGQTGRYPFSPAVESRREVDVETAMAETMLTGLRLVQEGVNADEFREHYGIELNQVFESKIKRLVRRGLLEWQENRLKLTHRARLVSNWVFEEFV